jgi:5-methylcytosine-specific restriction protein A
MTRRKFIESYGATCKNWQWSWSFINEAEKFVIFGAWDRETEGKMTKILSEDWKINRRGKKNAGYPQSLEHIRLIEENGFRLMTFPMQYSDAHRERDGKGSAKIGGFTPELTEKKLIKIGDSYYAADSNAVSPLAEELPKTGKFLEGAKTTVTINAYERNPKARAACVAHHGYKCTVCGFDFSKFYGEVGKDFIHVHHIVSIGKIGKRYEIDPITDLTPVCPNCHAMIHRIEPPLTVEQLRKLLYKTR